MQNDALVRWSFSRRDSNSKQAFHFLRAGGRAKAGRRRKAFASFKSPPVSSPCWKRSSLSWWSSEFDFRGEGESGKQTECCSGDFSLPPLGPLPTVFIDFNHWRLAGSQKKHCVMCSFLAFIKETQCSAVTLPSSPGNLPTPCGTSFIGGDQARGLGLFYSFLFFFNSPARVSKQPMLCFYLLSQPKAFFNFGRNCQHP